MKTTVRFFFLVGLMVFIPVLSSISQVSINITGVPPVSSAMLEVSSTNSGFLLPRMTRAELYSISSPANGLLVYCTDCGSNGLGALSIFMGGAWYSLNINCLIPLSPVSGTHVPSLTQIIWNWNPVIGATGYKWNTINDYSSATDMGTSTTITETGLTPGTTYTRFVWAYNNCGNSISTTLTSQASPYLIGQSYGGGIIFYIDGTGQHGLISAASDQATNATWGCKGTIIGVPGTSIGTGLANTIAIVSGCSTTDIAARICDDLVLNGYNDWFLPSLDELFEMYKLKEVLGMYGFVFYYWSSTEGDGSYAADYARDQDFYHSFREYTEKNQALRVRAIRVF